MASEYLLSPQISSVPLNSNVGFNNSWIGIKNPFGIPYFAQLTYVTNLDDIVLEIDDIEELVERSNSLLEVLTSFGLQELTYLDKLTSLAYEIEQNTDILEPLIIETNTLLNGYTAIFVDKQNQLIGLGHSLTSIQVDKQNQLISLGHSLTSIAREIDLNTDDLESLNVESNNLLSSLTSIQVDKQNQLISLGHSLTSISNRIDANTDHLENLIIATNDYLNIIIGWDYSTATRQDELYSLVTLLKDIVIDKQDQLIALGHSLTSIQVDKQDQLIGLGHSLTSIQVDKQNQIIGLGHSLTSIQVDKQDQIITLLHQLTSNTDEIEINLDNLEINTDGVETLLDSLTSITQNEFNETQILLGTLTSIQVDKQDQVIGLLHSLTAKVLEVDINTDSLEINTDGLETLLDSLTSITQNEFNETQILLGTLTSIQVDKQDQVIGLLHSLTAKVLEVDINTDSLEINTDGLETLIEVNNSYLNALTASNEKIAGFNIPPYDEISVDYVNPTNNIKTVTYLNNSTIVLSLSFTYYPNPPTDDDSLCVNIKKTI